MGSALVAGPRQQPDHRRDRARHHRRRRDSSVDGRRATRRALHLRGCAAARAAVLRRGHLLLVARGARGRPRWQPCRDRARRALVPVLAIVLLLLALVGSRRRGDAPGSWPLSSRPPCGPWPAAVGPPPWRGATSAWCDAAALGSSVELLLGGARPRRRRLLARAGAGAVALRAPLGALAGASWAAAAASRRRGGPSPGRWRWPAWPTARRACLRGCARSLRGRTRPPASTATCLDAWLCGPARRFFFRA